MWVVEQVLERDVGWRDYPGVRGRQDMWDELFHDARCGGCRGYEVRCGQQMLVSEDVGTTPTITRCGESRPMMWEAGQRAAWDVGTPKKSKPRCGG